MHRGRRGNLLIERNWPQHADILTVLLKTTAYANAFPLEPDWVRQHWRQIVFCDVYSDVIEVRGAFGKPVLLGLLWRHAEYGRADANHPELGTGAARRV